MSSGHGLSDTVSVCLWLYMPVTFPPLRAVMNNSPHGSYDTNGEVVSLSVLPDWKSGNVQLFKSRSQYSLRSCFWDRDKLMQKC